MEVAAALHHTSGLRTSSTAAATQSASDLVAVVGSLPPCEVFAAPVFDHVPVVCEQVIAHAIPRVVGSLPPLAEFARPVSDQVYLEQYSAGETTENTAIIPVVQEQVLVQGPSRVVGSLPPVAEFTEPVYNHFHQEQFSSGETTENFANFPIVQEQVLVQAIPRLVGSLPPVDEFTANVARRPLPLVEVRPSARAQRHIVEDLGELAPLVQILDLPVPQTVDSVTDVLRLLDRRARTSLCKRQVPAFARTSLWSTTGAAVPQLQFSRSLTPLPLRSG